MMIAFSSIQMPLKKRKSPQSVIAEVRIEGVNVAGLFFTFIYGEERVYELAECQFVIFL